MNLDDEAAQYIVHWIYELRQTPDATAVPPPNGNFKQLIQGRGGSRAFMQREHSLEYTW